MHGGRVWSDRTETPPCQAPVSTQPIGYRSLLSLNTQRRRWQQGSPVLWLHTLPCKPSGRQPLYLRQRCSALQFAKYGPIIRAQLEVSASHCCAHKVRLGLVSLTDKGRNMHELHQLSQPALSFPLYRSNGDHRLIPHLSVANYCIRSGVRNSNVQKQTTKVNCALCSSFTAQLRRRLGNFCCLC